MQTLASSLMITLCLCAFSFSSWAKARYDGPAELPRVTVASSLGDTPARGSIVAVNAGGNLQAALNNAFCGDTIELQAGATFTGTFTLPAKSCDSGRWIVVALARLELVSDLTGWVWCPRTWMGPVRIR